MIHSRLIFGVLAIATCVSCAKQQKQQQEHPEQQEPEQATEPTNKTFKVGDVQFDMIYVKGGTFVMGTAEQTEEQDDREKPAHNVTLSDYYIGQMEVTQALWEAVMGNNPSTNKAANYPVETISLHDCEEFLTQLNSKTGAKFCIPTEAEWEYAARGGCKSKGYKFSGSDNVDIVAWTSSNSEGTTHQVGTKSPNELGIYDMSGNVCEWCADWMGAYPADTQTNPTGAETGDSRVMRGGSAFSFEGSQRVAYRNGNSPGDQSDDNGLRLCLHQ